MDEADLHEEDPDGVEPDEGVVLGEVVMVDEAGLDEKVGLDEVGPDVVALDAAVMADVEVGLDVPLEVGPGEGAGPDVNVGDLVAVVAAAAAVVAAAAAAAAVVVAVVELEVGLLSQLE